MKLEKMLNLLDGKPESRSVTLQGFIDQLGHSGNPREFNIPARTRSFKSYLDRKD